MALIDDVTAACERLAPEGWGDLLARHGLELGAPDLRAELLRDLPDLDRDVPGFEDFSPAGRRAIEPGHPASSVLFHALASPNVIEGAAGELGAFPTLAEIEAVEHFVFGVEPPSLAEVHARFPDAPLAVAVFASEYRPALDTVHRSHADLCLSRTGVARVGTAEEAYDARLRGFVALADGDDDHTLRVLPARYAAYLAVQLEGDPELFGPMNFDFRRRFVEPSHASDGSRSFWVPLHKLFGGEECLRGLTLSVELRTGHLNEKIRRVHRHLHELGQDTGWGEPDIDEPPFVFDRGIAELSTAAEHGRGLLVPTVHERLVEPAEYRGEPLTFIVPPDEAIRPPGNDPNGWAPSLTIYAESDRFRPAPEYVHVRHVVGPGGDSENLNDQLDPARRVIEGGFRARHYVDFTGDGWVAATCPELAEEGLPAVPAYSMVTAPDFFPTVEQRELMEWWKQSPELSERLWQRVPPLALSDERIAPNLQLEGAGFVADDTTPTAIVSLPGAKQGIQGGGGAALGRHTHLPDGAAGVFAPGWDTSRDHLDGAEHLAAYGLGSPFPEDAKLCAALSSFWPAAAPDAGRSFWDPFPTATPMTDEEIGSVGDLPWDGIPGPRLLSQGVEAVAEYASFEHVDYVESALGRSFSLALTGAVDAAEYMARILALARSFEALGINPQGRDWNVLSFRPLGASDAQELADAEQQAGERLPAARYRVQLGLRSDQPAQRAPGDHRKLRVAIVDEALLLVGAGSRLLLRQGDAEWAPAESF